MFQNKKIPLGWMGLFRFLPNSGSRYITRSIPIEFRICSDIYSEIKDLSDDLSPNGLQSSLELLTRELVNTRGSRHEPYSKSLSSDNPRNFVLGNYFSLFSKEVLSLKNNCLSTDLNTSIALVHIFGITADSICEEQLDKVLSSVTMVHMDELCYTTNLNASFDFFLYSSREPKSASDKDSLKKETTSKKEQTVRGEESNSKVTTDFRALENLFVKYISEFEDQLVARIQNTIRSGQAPIPV
jgi:hypothetical protein